MLFEPGNCTSPRARAIGATLSSLGHAVGSESCDDIG
jgi:hypothetical protein